MKNALISEIWDDIHMNAEEPKKTIPASNAGFLTTGQSPCSSRYAYNA